MMGRRGGLALGLVCVVLFSAQCRFFQPRAMPPPRVDPDLTKDFSDEQFDGGEPEQTPPGDLTTDGGDASLASDRPDRQGRPVTTVFSGAELIREVGEDEDGFETVRITIRGGATIRHDKIVITANRMVVEDGVRGKLEGRVRVYDRESGVRVYGARADYVREEQLV